MLPAVNSVGRAYAARRRRRSGARGSTTLSLNAIRSSSAARDDGRPSGSALAGTDHDLPFLPEQDVRTRAEFNQTDPFAGGNTVAGLLREDDAAGDQSGNLLEHHRGALALDRHDVLLVDRRALLAARHLETALLILHFGNGSTDWRAVDVHVEDVQKDTDAVESGGLGLNGDDFPV